jgi:AcrR family transcriptional regulator
MLYRQFGDKEGLLSAVVDYGFEQYLASKRARPPSADPVQDLRDGWDSHVAFAVGHPSFYRLMYSPAVRTPPAAAAEAHGLLVQVLERCAAAGRLRISPQAAAQAVMSANVGVALMLVTRPGTYTDPDLSRRVRDAVHADILIPAGHGDTTADDHPDRDSPGGAATRLGALLRQFPTTALTEAETALLQEWLARLSDSPMPT